MLAKDLKAILNTIGDEAKVLLHCLPGPKTADGDGHSGDLVYTAVTAVDGIDRVVVFTNCVCDRQGNHVFDAEPQFKRFYIGSEEGRDVAIADLIEQANCEPTSSVRDELRKEDLRQTFRSFEELLNKLNPANNTPEELP